MAKKSTTETKNLSGFCMTNFHQNCPHVFHPTDGKWSQHVCSCSCHPAGPENILRGAK